MSEPSPRNRMPQRSRRRRSTICTSRLGARMVPFAGYRHAGAVSRRHHRRASAHARPPPACSMSRTWARRSWSAPDHATAARALEALVPADILNLAPGRQRYTQLLNEEGGILDDLMVTRSADPAEDGVLMLVVNAARKDDGLCAHRGAGCPASVKLLRAEHRALLALQGPKAARGDGAARARCRRRLPFMSATSTRLRRHRLSHQPVRLHRRGRVRDFGQGQARGRDRRAAARRRRT